MSNEISIRYDDARRELVLNLSIPGIRDFEVSNSVLSLALLELSEQVENLENEAA